MNRRIETALRSKYNFRKQCSAKETNELCAQGYNNYYCCIIVERVDVCVTITLSSEINACVFKLSVERIVIIRNTARAYSG